MKKRMKCNDSISSNKSPLLLVIKFVLLIFISYFIVQLSIGAKETEERKNIPSLQTTTDFAKEYTKRKYIKDWKIWGSDLDYTDGYLSDCYFLDLSSDMGMLYIFSSGTDDWYIEQSGIKKNDNVISISSHYSEDSYININRHYKGNNTSYYFEYQNGGYVPNPQMEQETGFTMDEILEQADKMRIAFEEEMEKMHQYQIGRAKERRKKFADFGFITFLIFVLFYLFLKWISINRRADIEDKYPEEVLEETKAKEEEKFLKRKYVVLGCGMAFWIYMLIPVVSEYLLSPIEGIAKEYAAYGTSAVIAAIVFGMLWKRSIVGKTDGAGTEIKMLKRILRFLSGCVVTLIIIQLGIIFVPRFYSPEWRFYKINLLADGIAFLIFSVIATVKKLKTGTAISR